jgi:hypothetical protein
MLSKLLGTAIGIGIFAILLEVTDLAVWVTLPHSAAYASTKQFIDSEPAVSTEIGKITRIGLVSGTGDWSSTDGQANLKVRVVGVKGNGVITVLLLKAGGRWIAIEATLKLNTGETVRLR